MTDNERSKLAEQIYSIVSGADNKIEHTTVVGAIEEWLSNYDGGETVNDLAAEFQEYYY